MSERGDRGRERGESEGKGRNPDVIFVSHFEKQEKKAIEVRVREGRGVRGEG